ncbi:Mandelate racemase [hydrothermal vent metagenome]|uniref:Mandelate racemase n=1 Tax=hydrothermal vent metagenome TaxID=652676 RepID=A0A3B0UJ93_9ZZZZ
MPKNDLPKIVGFNVRQILAPLDKPHKTASGTIEVAPLALLDVQTNAGISGSSYVFTYTPMALKPVALLIGEMEQLLLEKPLEPTELSSFLAAKFRLLGNQGLVAIAISAIDMALWDALAKFANLPLANLLGAAAKPIRIYDSLGQMSANETAEQVEISLKNGFDAFKIKAGHSDPKTDVEVVRAIKNIAGPDTWIAVDFNQAFSASEAILRMRLLDEENLAWIEEPVRSEDFEGHSFVRSSISTPVQTGENWWGIPDMNKSIAADASDFVMPDAMKIGGVSGWIKAAALAEANGLPLSSHLFGEISAHLLAASPTAHMLEWMDIAGSINTTPPIISNGKITAADIAGSGLNWDEKALKQYLV